LIEEVNKNFSEVFDEIQTGKQLWKIFIVLALLFIIAEVAIARFWK
jgi:hypothetical protein